MGHSSKLFYSLKIPPQLAGELLVLWPWVTTGYSAITRYLHIQVCIDKKSSIGPILRFAAHHSSNTDNLRFGIQF